MRCQVLKQALRQHAQVPTKTRGLENLLLGELGGRDSRFDQVVADNPGMDLQLPFLIVSCSLVA